MRDISAEDATNAAVAQNQLMAPLYTQRLQPVGTPANKVSWAAAGANGAGADTTSAEVWPLWSDVTLWVRELVGTKDAKALASIHKWFADSKTHKDGIKEADVAAQLVAATGKTAVPSPKRVDAKPPAKGAKQPPRPLEP